MASVLEEVIFHDLMALDVCERFQILNCPCEKKCQILKLSYEKGSYKDFSFNGVSTSSFCCSKDSRRSMSALMMELLPSCLDFILCLFSLLPPAPPLKSANYPYMPPPLPPEGEAAAIPQPRCHRGRGKGFPRETLRQHSS